MNHYASRIAAYLFRVGSATRSQIAQALDIRKNTVGDVCNALIENGRLREDSSSQQRNIPVSICPSSGFSVGVQHRPDELSVVIVDAVASRIWSRLRRSNEADEKARLAAICEEIRLAVEEAELDPARLLSIGFADFVPHDIDGELYVRSIWMPHWGAVDVGSAFQQQFGVSPAIMRCTDAHCLAEYAYGASADWTTYLEVQLDEGIGLSVFRDGDCLTGSTDIFGEIGHTIYHPDGDICKCGNRGCLETIAGISSIERKFIRAQSVVASSVDGKELSEITLNDIVSLSTDGSKTARLALKEAAAAVGNTLANVVNVLGIVDIVLYGPLTVARSILESEVTEALRSRCVFPLNQFVRVHFSELDRYATASGAAWESLRRWYNESRVSSSG